jgi:ferredoxin
VSRQGQPEPERGEGEGSPATERAVCGLRVQIDRALCVGFGDCVTASPRAFALGDDDVVVFVSPEEVDREQLLRACASCPVDALTVWDAEGTQIVP